MGGSEIAQYFDNPSALAINAARLDHLATLGLDLEGKRVLEVGAGVGHLTHFWEERGCEVVSTEGRPALVKENLRRHPGRRVVVANLCVPGSHDHLGRFDVIFCYGTLYHLSRPVIGLRNMAGLCDGLLLVESRVYPEDDGAVHFGRENNTLSQSLDGTGCRPARDWVMAQLKQLFPYVYATRTRPDHNEFPPKWPPSETGKPRAVFVASRNELGLPTLTTELPKRQEIP